MLLIAGLDLTSAKMATVNGQPVQGQQPSQAEQNGPPSAPNAAANVHAASNAYAILGASIAAMLHIKGRCWPLTKSPTHIPFSLHVMSCNGRVWDAFAKLHSASFVLQFTIVWHGRLCVPESCRSWKPTACFALTARWHVQAQHLASWHCWASLP